MRFADDLIKAFTSSAVALRYRRGRVEAARIHAADPRIPADVRTEWARVADTVEKTYTTKD